MKCILTVLLVCLVSGYACSQLRLSGNVANAVGRPVAFANLVLTPLTSQRPITTQTDSAGQFTVPKLQPLSYTLTVSLVGYQSIQKQLVLRRDTSITLIITETANQLEQVTVTAAKPVLRNSADKVVYDVTASVTAAGSDALSEMAKIPGVRISDNEVNVAGRGSVRVMLNGQLVQLSGQALARFLKGISANQLATIELIRNPPASLDAEGNAGLINITTRRSQIRGFSATIQTNAKKWLYQQPLVYPAPDYGAINATADVYYQSNKVSAFGSITTDHANLLEGFSWQIQYPVQTWIQSDTGQYRYHNLAQTVGIDYQMSRRTRIGANYLHEKNNYDGSDFVNNPIYNQAGQLDSTLKTHATYFPIAESNALNIHSITTFDTSGTTLSINADYFHYYRTDRSTFETNSFRPSGALKPLQTIRYFDTNLQDIHFYTLKADVNNITRLGRLSFGGKISFINTNSNAFYYRKTADNQSVYDTNLSNEFNYKENTQVFYMNLAKDLPSWKYQLGLRTEMTQTNGYSYTLDRRTVFRYVRLFPSVSLSRQLDKEHKINFMLNRRINRPTFWNLNPFKSLYTAYSYGEGNPYLQPEYTINAELSHTFRERLISSVFFSVTNNGFTNVTLARPDTNVVFTTSLNFIQTQRSGLTETFSLPITSWLETTNVVTAYFTQANSLLSTVENVSGWGFYVSSSNVVYVNRSKTVTGALNAWYQFPEVYRFGRSSGYYKVDLGLKASVYKKRIDLTLTVNDLFASSALAFSSVINNLPQRFINFQFNRFVLVGFSYHLGSQKTKSTTTTGNTDERKRI